MKTRLLFLSAILFSLSINAQIDFEAHVTVDDTGGTNNPQSVFAADLDGDGDMDMISASAYDNKIAWYENLDGQGTFGPQQIISEDAMGAISVFAADINGDSVMDIVFASSGDNTIGWYKNNGQGNFGPKQIISTLVNKPSSVYAADADGDGDMDVFSTSALDDKIAWYENTDGQGNFGPQHTISTAFDYPIRISMGDIDGDGDKDILSGSSYNNSRIAWFKNTNGQGNFVLQGTLNTDISYCRSAILADVDGDGDLDIVAVSMKTEGHRVIWFENMDGLGNFNPTPHLIALLSPTARPEILYAADFNNDGKIDIALGTDNEGVSWFKNNGSGNFGAPQFIDNDVYGVVSLFATDINGNGNQDLLLAAGRTDRVAWHENLNGQGSFGPSNELAAINGANGAYQIISADLDNDGDKDIIAALSNDNRVVWQENLDGQGNFSTIKTIGNLDQCTAVYVGDVDGDGYLDVLAAGSSALVWYKNQDGQGNFGPERIINTQSYNGTVHAIDLDNDGDLDIIAADLNSVIYWQENLDGLGNFGPIQIISNEYSASDSIIAVDIDNDGDKDIVVSYWGDGVVVWFENLDGLGNFGTSHLIDTLISPDSVFAADLDNDGDIDVVTLDYGTNEVMWYENTDGNGTFGSAQIISNTVMSPFSIYAKDLDNDGNIDVICGSVDTGEITWFKNDGNGNFNFQQTISSNTQAITSVFADDFNGDGKIDILACAFYQDQIIWFENKDPLAINENTTPLFNIYPNPTHNILNISGILPIDEITIYNNLGQLLFTSEGKNQIDISALTEGIYFLKIRDEKGQIETKKVIKR